MESETIWAAMMLEQVLCFVSSVKQLQEAMVPGFHPEAGGNGDKKDAHAQLQRQPLLI